MHELHLLDCTEFVSSGEIQRKKIIQHIQSFKRSCSNARENTLPHYFEHFHESNYEYSYTYFILNNILVPESEG